MLGTAFLVLQGRIRQKIRKKFFKIQQKIQAKRFINSNNLLNNNFLNKMLKKKI